MPRRISKKVSKIMDASALEKFKDTQAKNEHFERYNKETEKVSDPKKVYIRTNNNFSVELSE